MLPVIVNASESEEALLRSSVLPHPGQGLLETSTGMGDILILA